MFYDNINKKESIRQKIEYLTYILTEVDQNRISQYLIENNTRENKY